MNDVSSTALVDFYANIQHHIDTHGWSIQVTPYEDDTLMAYTVGLTLKNLPELTLRLDSTPEEIKLAGHILNKAAGLLVSTPSMEFSPYLEVPLQAAPEALVRFTLTPRQDTAFLRLARVFSMINKGATVRALDLTTGHDD